MKTHTTLKTVSSLSDDALLRSLAEVLGNSRRIEAELVAHIAEVDARRLYARYSSSMFYYCTEVLHLSESETWLRIMVAQECRKHPELLEMIADGRLHLSGALLISRHLTAENKEMLLRRATHRTKAQIKELIAEIAPKPDVPSSVRKLPEREKAERENAPLGPDQVDESAADPSTPLGPDQVNAQSGQSVWDRTPAETGRPDRLGPDRVEPSQTERSDLLGPDQVNAHSGQSGREWASAEAGRPDPLGPDQVEATEGGRSGSFGPDRVQSAQAGQQSPPRSGRGLVEPLSPARYKVQFTADAECRDVLEELRALMRSSVPDGDIGAIIKQALIHELERLEARRFGKVEKPRKSVEDSDTTPSSRDIPVAVKRAVYERDGNQCTFRDDNGRRCTEKKGLEFHHRIPFAQGGDHSVDNICLLCKTHNLYEAERDYGKKVMEQYRRQESFLYEPLAFYQAGMAIARAP